MKKNKRITLRIVKRYVLLQIPELLAVFAGMAILESFIPLRPFVKWMVVSLWLIKNIAVFPVVWRSYDPSAEDAVQSMVGKRGIAQERLAPEGLVRIGIELWQAKIDQNIDIVEKGDAVRVREVKGLLLTVEPEREF